MKHAITLNVNGEEWELEVEPTETLLEVLRMRVGVKSPKIGCERGDCGSCTVLLDGKAVRSCIILAVEADGHGIITVEGLSKHGLSELQKSFVTANAFQCGFCAPGTILAASELLAKNPRPTREDVQEAISGNLCRCTGYVAVIDAVLDASRKGGPAEAGDASRKGGRHA
jgi:aerobic-type carbon monoxide dehydrogenase small subunit (CoxS/CutS family)